MLDYRARLRNLDATYAELSVRGVHNLGEETPGGVELEGQKRV